MNKIITALTYNKFFFYLRKIKFLPKFLKPSPYVYEKYKQKDSLSNFLMVFYVLWAIIKHLIYLIFLFTIYELLKESYMGQNLIFLIWFIFLTLNNFITKTLQYNLDTEILFVMFKVSFKDIYKHALIKRFINRITYAILFFIFISTQMKYYSLGFLGAGLILFYFYFVKSITLLYFDHKYFNIIRATVHFIFLISFVGLFLEIINPAIFLTPFIIYIIFSLRVIKIKEPLQTLETILVYNIHNHYEILDKIGDAPSTYKEDKEIDLTLSGDYIDKYHSHMLYQHLFLDRHQKLWKKPIKIFSIGQILVYSFITILLILNKFKVIEEEFSSFAIFKTILSASIYALYFYSISENMAKAYYNNGDYFLLHYAFYKRKDVVFKQYLVRLLDLFKMAIIPVVITTLFTSLWYLLMPLKVSEHLTFLNLFFFLTLFLHVHHLMVYYLIQPYNKELNAKSGWVILFQFLVYLLAYMNKDFLFKNPFQIVVPLFVLSFVGITTTLVYLLGSKTFTYKD